MKTKIKIAFCYWMSGWCMVVMIWDITEEKIVWSIIMGLSTIALAAYPTLLGWWKEVA